MAKLQCPNCGGYDTASERERAEESASRYGVAAAATIFLWWTLIFLPLIWWAIWRHHDQIIAAASPDKYTCRLCKYEWTQKPGEALPVNVDAALIQQGRQRLDEEQ